MSVPFSENEVKALVLLSGLEIKQAYQIANRYWPDAYVDAIKNSPWFLLTTRFGEIVIGWRKRVLEIDWSATKVRIIITDKDVTKDETMVHAYNYSHAVAHLTKLQRDLERVEYAEQHPETQIKASPEVTP